MDSTARYGERYRDTESFAHPRPRWATAALQATTTTDRVCAIGRAGEVMTPKQLSYAISAVGVVIACIPPFDWLSGVCLGVALITFMNARASGR